MLVVVAVGVVAVVAAEAIVAIMVAGTKPESRSIKLVETGRTTKASYRRTIKTSWPPTMIKQRQQQTDIEDKRHNPTLTCLVENLKKPVGESFFRMAIRTDVTLPNIASPLTRVNFTSNICETEQNIIMTQKITLIDLFCNLLTAMQIIKKNALPKSDLSPSNNAQMNQSK